MLAIKRSRNKNTGSSSRSNTSGAAPWWHIGNVFRNADKFGKPIPSFNLKGETNVKTVIGGIMSLLVSITVLIYSTIKMIQLVNNSNPELGVVTSLGYIQPEEKVNLNEINFRMAFVVEGFSDRKRKADPRYVKYIARLWTEHDSISSFRHIDMHECNDSDLDQFYEVESNSKKKFDKIREDPNHGFFCIDWEKEDFDL